MVEWLAVRHWGLRTATAILAGVLTAFGFQPYGWWPLLLVGVSGLSVAVAAARRVRGAAGLGFAYGIGFLALGVGWMSVIFVEAMVALVVIEALFYAALGALLKLSLRLRWWPLLAAACWSLVEFTFARFPFNGFGWMRLGFAMVDSPLAAMLPLTGVATLSFATALVGQLLAWLVIRFSVRRLGASAAALATLAVVAAAGAMVPAGTQTGTVSVGWVQGGAPGGGVYGLGTAREITRNQAAESYRLADKIAAGEVAQPDFVVWPENGTDMDPFTDPVTAALVQNAVQRLGVPTLIGAILDGPGADERQTASLWWDPNAGAQQRYVKRGIVPFGEWVPLRSLLLPLIPELAYVGAQSVPGTRPGVLDVTLADGSPLKIGVMVCYDLIFDDFAYDTVLAGGQVQIVQSSNAQYQGTGQIDQQFAITRVRAKELGREQLVVTTSGVSGLINADGQTVFTAPDHVGASGVVALPVREGITPAARIAGWLEAIWCLLAAAGLIGTAVYGRMGRAQQRSEVKNGAIRGS